LGSGCEKLDEITHTQRIRCRIYLLGFGQGNEKKGKKGNKMMKVHSTRVKHTLEFKKKKRHTK